LSEFAGNPKAVILAKAGIHAERADMRQTPRLRMLPMDHGGGVEPFAGMTLFY
jgi:hypothetical protein